MKKMIAFLTAGLLLLSACSSATLDSAGKELEDAITNISDADNKYVLMVKDGYRTDDPSVTYEDAFSAFFGTPRWKYFKGTEGQDVVEFTGDCIYQDVTVKARIQFVVDEENGTFQATYLAFNEVPQDALTLAIVISKAFEAANEAGAESTAIQLCYRDISLADWIGCTADSAYDVFGWPDYGTMIDGYLYDGGEYFGYNSGTGGVSFIIDYQTGTIGWITGAAEAIEVNGLTLDVSRTELINLFGTPDSEMPVHDEMVGPSDYYIINFTLDGVSVQMKLPDINGSATSVMISKDPYWY